MTVTVINKGIPEGSFTALVRFCSGELLRRGIPVAPDGEFRQSFTAPGNAESLCGPATGFGDPLAV